MTERQFAAAMREAGWMNQKQGLWVHGVTEQKFYAHDGVVFQGRVMERWQVCAENGTLPRVEEQENG